MLEAVVATDIVLRRDERLAVDRSSFSVPAGAITAVIGPNGSGKSTVLHTIAGLIKPASGSIQVAGEAPSQARRKVSYVLQSTQVNEHMPVTVREAVLMGRFATRGWLGGIRPEDRDRVQRALHRLDLADLADRHLTELSGGQRQRTFVAQGLAQDHELLLLDEPMTGLDTPSAQVIDAVVHEEQAAGRTVILTTHDFAEASAADHVLLLAGRVVASGRPDEVLTKQNLATAYGTDLRHDHPGLFLDDPAHTTQSQRHVHRERGR